MAGGTGLAHRQAGPDPPWALAAGSTGRVLLLFLLFLSPTIQSQPCPQSLITLKPTSGLGEEPGFPTALSCPPCAWVWPQAPQGGEMEGMVALEGMYGWECRRQMGCCSLGKWDAGPAQPSLPWPHARASSCPLKPCCPWCSWLLPSYSTWFLFCLPFQVYLVLALPVCPSQFTLALGTTHSFSWVQPKHFPLHWACIAPHPISFQGETNPSSSAGHSSPANCLRPVPGAILSPTAPAFVCMSAQPLLCPTPLRHGALAGCQAGLLTHNLPSSAEGTKHQGRGHGGCAGATLPCTSYLQ